MTKIKAHEVFEIAKHLDKEECDKLFQMFVKHRIVSDDDILDVGKNFIPSINGKEILQLSVYTSKKSNSRVVRIETENDIFKLELDFLSAFYLYTAIINEINHPNNIIWRFKELFNGNPDLAIYSGVDEDENNYLAKGFSPCGLEISIDNDTIIKCK